MEPLSAQEVVRNRCTTSLLPFLSLLPFSPTLGGTSGKAGEGDVWRERGFLLILSGPIYLGRDPL